MTTQAKVAVVTGGGSGIGRAVALALANEGYAVVVAGRRKDALESITDEAARAGLRMMAIPTDVRDQPSVQSLFAKTNAAFGRLDLLFNNAGAGAPPVLIEELTYDQWKVVVDTNLSGAFLCTQEAVKLMK